MSKKPKQPWQMTLQEWEDAIASYKSDVSGHVSPMSRRLGNTQGARRGALLDQMTGELRALRMHLPDRNHWGIQIPAQHKDVVEHALSLGHKVPKKALATYLTCKFCGKLCHKKEAHLHDGGHVGDECCWDERLRSTE